jgi:hypothetical protein
VGYEEFDVAGGPEVAYSGAAKVSNEADVGYEDAGRGIQATFGVLLLNHLILRRSRLSMLIQCR